MSFWTNPIVEIETIFGRAQVDINTVVADAANFVQLAGHELDALLHWGLVEGTAVANGLLAAAPLISGVTAAATLAATGNPMLAQEVGSLVNGVNEAFVIAQKAKDAMNAATDAMQKSAAQGKLVSDTSAIAAGVQSVIGARASVTNLSNVAVQAAKAINALASGAPATAPAAP